MSLRTCILSACLFAVPAAGRADLVISEFMAGNQKGIADEDGDRVDWIEIRNTEPTAAVLTGWALTDNAASRQKWLFPSGAAVPANGQIVVYASGKNRAVAGQNLHTNFSLAAAGEYLALVRPDDSSSSEWTPAFPAQFPDISFGTSSNLQEEDWIVSTSPLKALVPEDTSLIPQWRARDYNESGWEPGTFAVGYQNGGGNSAINVNFGTDSAATMSGNGRHSYIRVPFQVADPARVQSLKLRMSYDDGFVAWINGTRIGNSAGAPVLDPISNTALVANHGPGTFEEFPVPAAGVMALTSGTNLLAIEGMNTTTGSSDAFISAQLTASLLIPGDGLTGYFATATPGFPNGGPNTQQLPVNVTPSRASGTFTTAFDLTLTGAGTGQEIRYILADPTSGTGAGIPEPTKTSSLYTAPIAVTSSKVLRAAVFEGQQRGRYLTAQYLQLESDSSALLNTTNFTSSLPVIVLDDHGKGQPVDSNSVTYTTTMMHAFEPASGVTRLAEEATGSGIPEVFTRGGARVRGSSSAGFAKKSYGIETRNESDEDEDTPLLGMAPDSDWVLNGPYLFDDTYIHNAYAYEISRRLGRWAPRTRPCELFMNQNGGKLDYGDYAGVYMLTEKIKSNSARLPIVSPDPGETAGEALTGGYIFKIDRPDADEYRWTINNSAFGLGTLPNQESGQSLIIVEPDPDHDTTEQQNYLKNTAIQPFNDTLFQERATAFATRNYRNHIDVGSFVDHHLVNSLAMNVDALRLSAFYFKDRSAKISAGPVWDFDRALGSDDGRDANPSSWNSIGYFFDRDWWGGLFRDPQFVQEWVDRWWALRQAGQPLATSALTTLADQMGAEIGNAAGARDAAKWSENTATGGVYLNEISAMKNWLTSRVNFIDGQTPGPPATAVASGTVPAGSTVSLSGAGSIRYTLDNTDPRPFGGSTATSAATYSGPIAINSSSILTARRQSSFTPFPNGAASISWSAPLTRVLLVDEAFATSGDLSVTAINYHPFAPTAAELAALPGIDNTAFEWLEIRNTGTRNVNTIDVTFPSGAPFDGEFKLPLRSLPPGQSLLLVKNRAAFELRYGTGASGLIAGEWVHGGLKDSGEEIRPLDRGGNPIFSFAYSDQPGWPELADGKGAALEYRGGTFTSAALADGANWQASVAINGTPGGDPAGAASAVTFHEILAESASPFVDAFELRNSAETPVTIDGWFVSDDAVYDSLEDYQKFRIPGGSQITAGGYAVFTETAFNPNGAWNPAPGNSGPGGFSLDGVHGGTLRLFSRDAGGGLRLADTATYGSMRVNESHGRRPDSPAIFDPLANPTLFDSTSPDIPRPGSGADNTGVRSGPVLIHEIHHTPADGNADLAFIELSNPSPDSVSLASWQLRGSVSRDFSATETIPGNGLLVAVHFDPAETAKSAAFRDFWKIDSSVAITGPWTADGAPGSPGEIILNRAGTPPAGEPGYIPYTLEDRSSYQSSAGGWPETTSGFSLNRTAASDGSAAANWRALTPTPGDFESSYNSWKAQFFPNGEPASPDPDGDGILTILEYAFNTDPLTPDDAQTVLPVLTTAPAANGGTEIIFTYNRPINRAGVIWSVEESNDLAEWRELPSAVTRQADGRETIQSTMDSSASNNIFLRLRVTLSP